MSRTASITTFLLFLLVFCGSSVASFAQCAMCRASVASSLSDGGKTASNLNTGILYLASMPYLILAVIGWLWYRNSKKRYESTNYPSGFAKR